MIWTRHKADLTLGPSVKPYEDFIASLYDRRGNWYSKVTYDEIAYYFGCSKHGRALEVATGTGRISVPLLHSGADIYGFDGSLSMLTRLWQKVRSEHRSRFIRWDAQQRPYPIPPKHLNTIIVPFSTFGILHCGLVFNGESPILKELVRIVTDNGLILINDFRTLPFDREKLLKSVETVELDVQHPTLGELKEVQRSLFTERPDSILTSTIIRTRTTTWYSKYTLEQFYSYVESLPVWDTEDLPKLFRASGVNQIESSKVYWHHKPSIIYALRF